MKDLRITSIFTTAIDSFAIDFINYGDKIIYCAMFFHIGYINEATNFAKAKEVAVAIQRIGDGRRTKIRLYLRQATKMVKPRKGKGLSRKYKEGTQTLLHPF